MRARLYSLGVGLPGLRNLRERLVDLALDHIELVERWELDETLGERRERGVEIALLPLEEDGLHPDLERNGMPRRQGLRT